MSLTDWKVTPIDSARTFSDLFSKLWPWCWSFYFEAAQLVLAILYLAGRQLIATAKKWYCCTQSSIQTRTKSCRQCTLERWRSYYL